MSLSGHAIHLGKAKADAEQDDARKDNGLDLCKANISSVRFENPQQLCAASTKKQSLKFVTDYNLATAAVCLSHGDQKVTTVASNSWPDLDQNVKLILTNITGVAVDSYGYMYISSPGYNFVAALSPQRVGGLIAGRSDIGKRQATGFHFGTSSSSGYVRKNGVGMDDGIASEATFLSPSRLLLDPASHCLYVSQEHCIRKIILPMMPQIPEQQQQLEHLEKITDKGLGADIVLTVNGTDVHAIADLLCQNSEYFQRMFASSMTESSAKRDKKSIEIKDSSCEAVKAVSMWIMFGVIILHNDTPSDTVVDTLRLANCYFLTPLKDRCAALLMRRLEVRGIFDILRLSCETRMTFLKSECIAFMVKNLKEVRKRDEFQQLDHDILVIILSQVKAD